MSDLRLCREWIASYVRPCGHVNHMHGEASLRAMILADTSINLTPSELRALMRDAGHEPANQFADEWEWHISSAPFRARPKARVGGWTAAARSLRATRKA